MPRLSLASLSMSGLRPSTCVNLARLWLVVRAALAIALCALVVGETGCGPTVQQAVTEKLVVSGSVHGGQQPVTGALLQLYAVGSTGDGSAASPLIGATLTTSDGTGNGLNTNANAGNLLNTLNAGSFTITGNYSCPTPDTQVYLTATGGNPGLAPGTSNPALSMLAVLGRCGDLTPTTNVSINELTTVGSLAPLLPYMNGPATLGSGSGDAAQFLAALNLVKSYTDTSSGSVPGPTLPAGYYASSQEIATLGDILAGCINSDGTTLCSQLFALAQPPGGIAPTDTVTAALDILKNPTHNTAQLFALLAPSAPFQPTLTSAPKQWALPILPIAATPSISPASGSYAVAPTVTLSSNTPGASIYYTLNGTTPTTSSTLYTGPFSLTSTGATSQNVRAIALAPGFATSGVASATYTIPLAGTTTNLVFLIQPTTEVLGTALPAFRLGFVDSYGNAVHNAYASIALSIGTNPGNTSLTGTTQTNSGADGTVTVTGVFLNAMGTGYTLKATWSNGSAISLPFNVISPPITLTTQGPLVGSGTTLPGSFTLSQAAPAGGLTVALSSSNAGIVSIAAATVSVAAGQTTGAFTYTSTGPGTATLRASATGFNDGTVDETTTASFISLGTLPSPLPGASAPINLTLASPAPAGGITVTLSSGSPAIATVSGSATFAGGATIPTVTPQLTAKTYGLTQISATATNFGPAFATATIAGTSTVTATLTLGVGGSAIGTITIGQAAPAGGVIFSIATDNQSVAGPQVSNVTVPAGGTSVTFTVLGYGVGSTTLRVNSAGFAEATTAVAVTGSFSLVSNFSTQPAAKMYVPNTLTLSAAPGAPTDITLTSSNPAALLLSTNPNVTGSASIVLTGFTGKTIPFYEQGQAPGAANISVTGTGYATLVSAVTVNQTLLVLQSFAPNTLSSTSPSFEVDVALAEAASNGAFVGGCAYPIGGYGSVSALGCRLNPGVTLTAEVTSSNTAAGTMTASPVTLGPGSQLAITRFQPVGAGSSTITLGAQPTGFYTSTGYPYYLLNTFAVTVSQPTFTVPTQLSSYVGMTNSFASSLTVADTRPGGATVTVSVANPAIASISTDPNVVGGSSVTLTGITSALPTLYLQGLGSGTTALNFSSPSYKTSSPSLFGGTTTIVFTDSFGLSGYTTDSPKSIEVGLACSPCVLSPGAPATFTVTSSNSAVATFSNPLTLQPGTSKVSGTLTPVGGGSTTIAIGPLPAPFAAPNAAYGTISRSATFTQAVFLVPPVTTGVNLYVNASISPNSTPGSPVTVTVTSSNPAVALISKSATTLGSAAFTYATSGGSAPYYVQGISPGTSTLTVSGAGFTTATTTITVDQSGVIFYPATALTTTAFSNPTALTVYLVAFSSAGSPALYCQPGTCALNPGASVSSTITSSNSNAGTVAVSTITFAPGTGQGSASFVPNDLGSTVLTLSQPTGFTASATGLSSQTFTVTGDPIGINPIVLAAGLTVKQTVDLPSSPPKATTVTVSVADGSLAKLSTDPNVMGTGSTLVFNNVTNFYNGNAGGIPAFYIQGVSPGYTRLTVSSKGYASAIATISIDKLGITLAAPSGVQQRATSSLSGNPIGAAAVTLSLLDPYSLTTQSDCTATFPCTLNPGVASPSIVLTTADPSIGTFPSTPTPYTINSTYSPITFTPVAAGFTNYSLGTQSAGYFNTTTAVRRGGLGSVLTSGGDLAHALFISAPDIDAGVGVEVVSSWGLSGTVFNYNTTPFTATVADPTIAVLSGSGTVAGGASYSYTGYDVSTNFYVQGLKAGTTTVTISGAGYAPRTVTLTVRPAGFTIKQRDVIAVANPHTGAYYGPLVTVKPAVLDALGQWMVDAQINPQSPTVSVAVSSGNTGVGTILVPTVSFAPGASQGTFEYDGVAIGSTTLSLGAVSAPFIQATTYGTINAVTR